MYFLMIWKMVKQWSYWPSCTRRASSQASSEVGFDDQHRIQEQAVADSTEVVPMEAPMHNRATMRPRLLGGGKTSDASTAATKAISRRKADRIKRISSLDRVSSARNRTHCQGLQGAFGELGW